MPGGREKPLHLQTTTDLWVAIIVPPVFGSFFVVVPILGTPVSGSRWSALWLVPLFVGVFTLVGVLGGAPRLRELHRRGAWVPPGVARQPVLVSIVLALLILAASVADLFVMAGVAKLAVAAGLGATFSGVLASVLSVSLAVAAVFVLRRWARKPPGSEGNGTTDPNPPAERPREEA